MIPRLLRPTRDKSFFLFGPRGAGKSTFLRHWFTGIETLWIDLLSPEQEDRYARNPEALAQQIAIAPKRFDWVVIDEIQKVTRLLDVVHQQIESRGIRFALTGSSARKLKHGQSNLLAGRAFVYHLFPFVSSELGNQFDLDSALMYGTLPGQIELRDADDKNAFLRAYALTYLKEEIWSEHVVRKLDPFRAFLEIAAQSNGEIINYSKIARDVGVDIKSVQSYFQILEDTLVGFLLEPYHASVRKRQIQAPRFFFFDLGVKRALDRTLTVHLQPGTYAYGKAFEHFIVTEALRRSHYLQNDFRFSYLKTKDGAEIDMIIERPGLPTALLEIKSSRSVDEHDVRAIARFRADMPNTEGFCLSLDPIPKRIGAVDLLPWEEGLRRLGLEP